MKKIRAVHDRPDRKPVTVDVVGLNKSYGSQSVLTDINLKVEPGEIFVIMGPSGSGKSVLLRQIAGLEVPTSGTVTINGQDPVLATTRDRFAVALVFQSGALFNSLSVYDNLALYLLEHRICRRSEIRDRVMRALQILSLESAAKKFPSELSGGMKKRVAIARALVMEPQLMLYDEPTSELDPVMSATISEIIGSLKNEYQVTSIVVSHDRDLAMTIANNVAIIMGGKIKTIKPPSELLLTSDRDITEFLNPKIDLNHPRYKELETHHE